MKSALATATIAVTLVSLGSATPASASSAAKPASLHQSAGAAATKDSAGMKIAARPCWASGGRWWCINRANAPVYARRGGAPVGYLRTTTSYFIYRCEGDHVGGGGPHPRRWLNTKADNGAWGFVHDSYIVSETNPLPNRGGC